MLSVLLGPDLVGDDLTAGLVDNLEGQPGDILVPDPLPSWIDSLFLEIQSTHYFFTISTLEPVLSMPSKKGETGSITRQLWHMNITVRIKQPFQTLRNQATGFEKFEIIVNGEKSSIKHPVHCAA